MSTKKVHKTRDEYDKRVQEEIQKFCENNNIDETSLGILLIGWSGLPGKMRKIGL